MVGPRLLLSLLLPLKKKKKTKETWQLYALLLYPSAFLSSSSSVKCKLPIKIHTVKRTSLTPHVTRIGHDGSYINHLQRSVVLRSALDEVPVLDPGKPAIQQSHFLCE